MDDLISRQAAIDALDGEVIVTGRANAEAVLGYANLVADRIKRLPSAHPGCDEWCTDCKEYDQEKHCCPRWNRVIKQTVEDVRKETPETTRILAEVLNGSPLLYPCDKLWSREGWCKDNCKAGQQEPDTECWLKYAEVMAAEMERIKGEDD